MGSYLQQYGVDDERRNRIIKATVISLLAVLIVGLIAYWIFQDFPEKRKAQQFLAQVNAHKYQEAYQLWGCTAQHPCPNYDFKRFVQDWTGGSGNKVTGQWQIASTDSCRSFLTVNVSAPGAELQSLAVQRSDKGLSFAPAPECMERKWRWKQFFERIMGKAPAPPSSGD